MKRVTIELYNVNELKELHPEGFERAYHQYQKRQEESEYSWIHEVSETMKKFLAIFNCQHLGWAAFDHVRFDYKMPEVYLENEAGEEIAYDFNELKGELLAQYFQDYLSTETLELFKDYGNCPLTGVCFDHEPLRVMDEYLKGNRPDHSLEDLIDEGLNLLIDEVESDIEYRESEAAFVEECLWEDLHFTAEGQVFA